MISKRYLLESCLLIWAAACICLYLAVTGCSTAPVTPVISPVAVTPLETPQPKPVSVDAIVDQSACARVTWPKQGLMPIKTLSGFAETYQKSLCAKRAVFSQPVATAQTDGFAIYHVDPTLENLYAILLDSAMMESSGNVCTGRDTSASAETSTEAESGLLQQSANVQDLNPALADIVTEYKAHPERCGFSTFRSSACSGAGIVSGPGVVFQKLMLTCPSLAIEQAAIGFRVGVRHWGPTRRKELIFKQECADMFKQIRGVTVCP